MHVIFLALKLESVETGAGCTNPAIPPDVAKYLDSNTSSCFDINFSQCHYSNLKFSLPTGLLSLTSIKVEVYVRGISCARSTTSITIYSEPACTGLSVNDDCKVYYECPLHSVVSRDDVRMCRFLCPCHNGGCASLGMIVSAQHLSSNAQPQICEVITAFPRV